MLAAELGALGRLDGPLADAALALARDAAAAAGGGGGGGVSAAAGFDAVLHPAGKLIGQRLRGGAAEEEALAALGALVEAAPPACLRGLRAVLRDAALGAGGDSGAGAAVEEAVVAACVRRAEAEAGALAVGRAVARAFASRAECACFPFAPPPPSLECPNARICLA
jgi:hypothetical protein